MFDKDLKEYTYTLIKSETILLEHDIEFDFFDYELDDFDVAGLLAGYYELRTYSCFGGYKCLQLVVDGVEIDIPNECYITNGYDIETDSYILFLHKD